jgi:hypothetical protein
MLQTKLVYNDTSHTYMLAGRRCKSVTAVAKIAPDSYALDQWRKRQVAIGMMHEPRLAERVAVDPDNRELVDAICEEAMRVAGAHHAADRGTQRHRAAELFDLGRPLITDQQKADAQAWQRTIEAHGIQILPQHVEGFAAWPQHGVTGRFDRIGNYQGRPRIFDLKSGENAIKYPQGTAVQLALYARAPMISTEVTTVGDQSTVTKWAPPPADLDLEVAYVILLGDDMELGELWQVDIAHGWAGAQHALALVDWRKEHGYGRLLAQQIKAEPRDGTDLLGLIAAAPDEDTLTGLWRQAKTWTGQHTTAAKVRKAELQTSPAVPAGSK